MSDSPNSDTRPTLIVVSGLSGAGKSVALNTLEDLDLYVADNLPVALLPDFVRSLGDDARTRGGVAVGVDVRNRGSGTLHDIGEILSGIGAAGYDHRLAFFEASDAVLLRRYSETRRRHPLSHIGLPLADAVALERQLLRPIRAIADYVIDTTDLNVHQLRRRVMTEVSLRRRPGLSLLFESFAYRHGVPADADFVFDARCLPNPHWDARLRPLSGRDAAVREHLDADPLVQAFLDNVTAFVDAWLPHFESQTRSYLTIAVGCTGGRHRSVYLAEALVRHMRDNGREDAVAYHRELD
ncbi:RNase adapter RapZ [Coralloluteibacterium thermophilus]|uniref:RNase adapter RapZ n=1 Tax=Coralloluteibacterium thermophilum TaxID=2707049 RepID=A0ABV9NHP1_9GAMM